MFNKTDKDLAVGKEAETIIGPSVKVKGNFHGDGKSRPAKIVSIYQFDGLTRVPVTEAKVGDIVCFAGCEDLSIGDTVCILFLTFA